VIAEVDIDQPIFHVFGNRDGDAKAGLVELEESVLAGIEARDGSLVLCPAKLRQFGSIECRAIPHATGRRVADLISLGHAHVGVRQPGKLTQVDDAQRVRERGRRIHDASGGRFGFHHVSGGRRG
jgi:hypothetical protein